MLGSDNYIQYLNIIIDFNVLMSANSPRTNSKLPLQLDVCMYACMLPLTTSTFLLADRYFQLVGLDQLNPIIMPVQLSAAERCKYYVYKGLLLIVSRTECATQLRPIAIKIAFG
jgi:hypothetical protein